MTGSAADWRPAATREMLRRRAWLLAQIRGFFAERGVLEVATPMLSAGAATDPALASLASTVTTAEGPRRMYWHTSPEFPMKRLLAAGSGPIYQVCRVFRDGEAGRLHNPEFTLLEWYRTGVDEHGLMDEVEALLARLLGIDGPAGRLSYAEAGRRHAGVDLLRATPAELAACLAEQGVATAGLDPDAEPDVDLWRDLVVSHLVGPRLGHDGPCFVHDFPASQAALARLRGGEPPVAARFELYLNGVELANGFHELGDAAEQRARFEADLARRRRRGLPSVPVDERLLAALEAGLPDCSGVALGLDRLLMVASGADDIRSVLAFPVDRA